MKERAKLGAADGRRFVGDPLDQPVGVDLGVHRQRDAFQRYIERVQARPGFQRFMATGG